MHFLLPDSVLEELPTELLWTSADSTGYFINQFHDCVTWYYGKNQTGTTLSTNISLTWPHTVPDCTDLQKIGISKPNTRTVQIGAVLLILLSE